MKLVQVTAPSEFQKGSTIFWTVKVPDRTEKGSMISLKEDIVNPKRLWKVI